MLNIQLKRLGKPVLDQKYTILKNYSKKGLILSQREGLVEEVGNGGKLASDVIKKVYPYKNSVVDKVVKSRRAGKVYSLEKKILVGGEDGLPLKIAACCKPKMGNPIVGYVTRGNSITIHRSSCHLLDSLNRERVVFADWKGTAVG